MVEVTGPRVAIAFQTLLTMVKATPGASIGRRDLGLGLVLPGEAGTAAWQRSPARRSHAGCIPRHLSTTRPTATCVALIAG